MQTEPGRSAAVIVCRGAQWTRRNNRYGIGVRQRRVLILPCRMIVTLQSGASAECARAPRAVHLHSVHEIDRAELLQRFGAFLLAENVVDRMSLDRAVRAAQTTGDRLDTVLTKLGLVSEMGLVAALAKFLALGLVRPDEVPIEPVLPELVEAEFVWQQSGAAAPEHRRPANTWRDGSVQPRSCQGARIPDGTVCRYAPVYGC